MFRLLFLLFLPFISFSQDEMKISYGHSLNVKTKGELYSFIIKSNMLNSPVEVNDLSKYIFEIPGEYYITTIDHHLHDESTCHHDQLPREFKVMVDSVQIYFHPNSLTLKKDLFQNSEVIDNVLKVNVELKNYYQSNIQFDYLTIKSAGIGVNLYGELISENLKLQSGFHEVKYKINGRIDHANYIQFDFIDSKGKVIPIGYLKEIKPEN